MKMKILRRDFKVWLESKEGGDVVGRKEEGKFYPLAMYIKDIQKLKKCQLD